MAKAIYLVNAFFGIIVGIIVILYAIAYQMSRNPGDAISWLVAGVIGLAFGIYQLKKYKTA